MNTPKFITLFIIFEILIKLMSAFNAHDIFQSVKTENPKNFHRYYCSCHKRGEELSEMMALKFKNGNTYLISEEPIGEGGTALVFHVIYFGKNWEMAADTVTKCEAIKVANPLRTENNKEIEKELAIIDDIFKQPDHYSIWPRPDHNLRFLRNEIFQFKKIKVKHSAIVMELGKQNLYEYWQEAMPQFCRCNSFLPARLCQKCTISEIMLLYIMREISLGLQQLHQRNYIFIDLKPQNVMVMPNSPDPKKLCVKPENVMVPDSPNPEQLCEENLGSLRIKLTDFGSALKFLPENGKRVLSDDEWTKLMGTKFYWAPEIYYVSNTHINNVISPGTDIYSLGRLMLMLAIQTPQMKKFTPEIEKILEIMNVKKDWYGKEKSWMVLLDEMLRVVGIYPIDKIEMPSNLEELSDYENEIFDHESEISDHESRPSNVEGISDHESDVERNKIAEHEKKEKDERKKQKEIEKEKRKKEIKEKNEILKTLYEELKSNFGHLMKIIEQTQAADQDQRPTTSAIIKECSPKLAHLKRRQPEQKLKLNEVRSTRPLFYSGKLKTLSSLTSDTSGSSNSIGGSSRSFKRGRRRWSMDNFHF